MNVSCVMHVTDLVEWDPIQAVELQVATTLLGYIDRMDESDYRGITSDDDVTDATTLRCTVPIRQSRMVR